MLQGWRVYTFDTREFVLRGQQRAWPTREMAAECNHAKLSAYAGEMRPEAIQEWRRNLAVRHILTESCGQNDGDGYPCGIYVLAKPPNVDKKGIPVLATVHAWGAVHQHESGFRAERVRIEALWVTAGSCVELLEGIYGVSVTHGLPEGVVVVDEEELQMQRIQALMSAGPLSMSSGFAPLIKP